ncbi:MAG: PHP domain-containing protein [Candidatus Firestonebacteria bacterium]|nr:PHP domain-containing protein [Candidatus Firestonebacteria bacterium]
MLYRLDLHIHSSASNCFKTEEKNTQVINQGIIQKAKSLNLNMIGITDHYSVKNFQDIKILADIENITVLPGVELSLKTHLPEKVSLVVLFKENTDPVFIKKILLKLNVPEETYGNGKYLLNQNIEKILSILRENDCLVISAHQDKNESRISYIPILISNGILLFDLHSPDNKDEFIKIFGKYNIIPLKFSDAHEINNVGKYFMELPLSSCSYEGVIKYFKDLQNIFQ